MKKLIAIMLLIAMCLSLFAGCGEEEQQTTAAPEVQSDLESAKAYLLSMYQSGKKDAPIEMAGSKDVLKSVVVAKVTYTIDWSVEVTSGAADAVTVGESMVANCVQLQIPAAPKEDVLFTATATISDPNGKTTTATFNYKIVGYAAMEKLVQEAYALEEGQSLEGEVVLSGEIITINSPYDESYKNITVTIQVGDLADMPVKCYRLTGDGADNLWLGDTITVSGILTNYNGSVQLTGEPSCKLTAVTKSNVPPPEAPADPKQIVAEAYALEKDASLPYIATLTGVITTVDSPYTEQYQNVTVTIVVEGCENQPIKCYRLKGEGAEQLAPGDTITVNGMIKNYGGTIEFDQGCKLTSFTKGNGPLIVAPEDPKQIVAEAYALEDGTVLPYTAVLTGVITSVDSPYDAGYQNITVTMTVEGCESQPIKCYRMKGTGVETLKVGDTITVSGTIKNYGGVIEFDTGCTLTSSADGGGVAVTPESDPAKIMEAANKLEKDQELPYDVTLSGKVTKVEDAYDASYENITVAIAVTGTRSILKCYRMKGEGVDALAVGDTITVTGRIKNYGGTVELVNGTMTQRTSGGGQAVQVESDPVKVVDAAYALNDNEELPYDCTLSGKVTAVNDAYNADYKNVSVTIVVSSRESKPVLCYRMKGEGADKLAVGDTITVTGRMKNYNGTVELVNGSMIERVSGGGSAVVQEKDPAKVLEAAKSLKEGEEMSYDVTLSGKITMVNDAYDPNYKSVTVTIAVSGTRSMLKIFGMKGDGVDQVAVGDTVTVTGRIKNYYGELEMVSSKMTARTSGGGKPVKVETDSGKIIDAGFALAENEELPYDVTLTGKVTMVNVPYDTNYKNINVTIAVSGRESKPLLCYRLKGNGVEKICEGDTITVTGRIKNYNGTIELVSCEMTNRVSGGGVVVQAPSDPKQIVDAAFALEKGASLPYKATLTGKIVEIPTEYSSQYKNVTVVIQVQGSNGMKNIECFRLKGTGVENLKVGDTITVSGVIKRYYKEATTDKPELDKVEFDAGCTLG